MLFPGLLTAIMSYIRKGEHLYTHDRVLDISVTELYAMLIMLKLLLITNKPNSPPCMYVMCVCVFFNVCGTHINRKGIYYHTVRGDHY
jgi:hypothetical protein